MSAHLIEADRTLPYDPAELCKLVGDVESYPSFLPWLSSLRIIDRAPLGQGWTGAAEARVGWRAFTVDFATKVRCAPETGDVDVTLIRGPFKTLENAWRFAPSPHGARVHCKLRYEFKNPVLQTLVDSNKQRIMSRILAAFEGEARRRLPLSIPSPP